MKSRLLITLLVFTTIIGCGEDVGSKRRSLIESDTPTITTDAFIVPSHMHRTLEHDLLASRTEIDEIIAGSLPVGYRTVPSMALDDEGTDTKNIRTRTSLGRPTVDCGMGPDAAISARISDCSTLNGTKATWNFLNSSAGESIWRLVAKVGTAEMWLDIRTGHIWSDIVATTNWCNASGNKETGTSVNCLLQGTNSTCVGKGILGFPGIKWRLPTRNDYLQADLNGIRFVLKAAGSPFWTATLNSASADRSEAWAYNQAQGTIEKAGMIEDRQVRCIGAAAL
ncbi:MAG: hypothetical protein V4598_06855 [Bdellovibrionota bacterium]